VVRAFQGAGRGVAVQADDEDFTQCAGTLQVVQVARMKEVEQTVSKNNGLAGRPQFATVRGRCVQADYSAHDPSPAEKKGGASNGHPN